MSSTAGGRTVLPDNLRATLPDPGDTRPNSNLEQGKTLMSVERALRWSLVAVAIIGAGNRVSSRASLTSRASPTLPGRSQRSRSYLGLRPRLFAISSPDAWASMRLLYCRPLRSCSASRLPVPSSRSCPHIRQDPAELRPG